MATLFFKQIDALLFQRGVSFEDFGKLVGMTQDQLIEMLAAKHDVASSTLDKLAVELKSEWVLVPKEHLTTVRRLLERDGALPDYSALSAAELYLATRRGTRNSGDEK